jgi:hypothetical protein
VGLDAKTSNLLFAGLLTVVAVRILLKSYSRGDDQLVDTEPAG